MEPERAREAIYRSILDTGFTPANGAVALRDLQALAAAHVIVMCPDGETIRYAAPFANGETAFRARSGDRSWFAPCAWDAFGIAAALHADVAIGARCAHSGEPIECGVRDGRSYGKGVVHLLVPAARFWENIIYT
jgi:Alkylmercury lyase